MVDEKTSVLRKYIRMIDKTRSSCAYAQAAPAGIAEQVELAALQNNRG